MSRLAARADLAVILLAFAVGVTAFNTWQRYDWAYVSGVVRNLTPGAVVVRVTDGTSGRISGTWEIAAQRDAQIVGSRLERWLWDPRPEEEAIGRTRHFILELLERDRCSLIDVAQVGHQFPDLDVGSEGFLHHFDGTEEEVGPDGARHAADPCRGAAATPRGLIANLTQDVAVVAPGLEIGPCSLRIVHPGDMAIPAVGTRASVAVTRFTVPSIKAQDERWPIEPRTVVLTHDDVYDEAGGAGLDAVGLSDCRALSSSSTAR